MILNGEYIEKLSDEELCMLEQLTYLDEMVAEKAGINNFFSKINKNQHEGFTISDILREFDDKAILRLMEYPESICDAAISGVEWAKIITYLKDPSHRISHLVVRDVWANDVESGNYRAAVFNEYECTDPEILKSNPNVNTLYKNKYIDIGIFHKYFASSALAAEGTNDINNVLDKMNVVKIPLAITFTDDSDTPDSQKEVIIAYKGTTGPNEWQDNVKAAYSRETEPQIAAVEYANKIAETYGDITVVGHSKGSNKAMYTTILCDDVVRCVGFDGEGFSKKFLTHYYDKIKERAHLITNYALSTDFVHELLYQLPGSRQLYTEGYGVEGIGANHAPMGFFEQEDNYTGIMDKKDNPIYDYMLQHATVLAPVVFDVVKKDYGFDEYKGYADFILNQLTTEKEEIREIAKNNCERGVVEKVIERAIKPGANLWELITANGYYKDYQEYLLLTAYEICGDDFRNFMKRYTAFGISDIDEDIPKFHNTKENFNITNLRGLTDYLVTIGNEDKSLLKYVEKLLYHLVLKEDTDGKDFSYNIIDKYSIVLHDKKSLSTLLGHILYYSAAHNIDMKNVFSLVESLSGDLYTVLRNFITASFLAMETVMNNNNTNYHNEIKDICVKNAILNTLSNQIIPDFYSVINDGLVTYKKIAIESFNDKIIKEICEFVNSEVGISILNGSDKRKVFFFEKPYFSSNDDIIKKYLENTKSSLIDFFKTERLLDKIRAYTEYKEEITKMFAEKGYRLILGSDIDEVITYDSKQQIYTNKGDDRKIILLGGSGDDEIYVNGNRYRIDRELSQIRGGMGDDTITISGENMLVHGDYGKNDIGGSDTIYGSNGNDKIFGDGGYDQLYGNGGTDVLYGNGGQDILSGGRGNDEMYGGSGNDIYEFYSLDDNDIVKDSQGNNLINFADTDISNVIIEGSKVNSHNITFIVKSTQASLTIIDYDKTSKNFAVSFKNGNDIYSVEKSKDGDYSFKKMDISKPDWLKTKNVVSGYYSNLKQITVADLVKQYKEANEALPTVDPLIINFNRGNSDNNGLFNVDNGVHFDLDNNGIAEKTAWIDPSKGFLVLDRNGDGKINNGGDLFGDQVILNNGNRSKSGFEALAELDDNVDEVTGEIGDGIIDEKDSKFSELKVWIDENSDGYAAKGEIKSLSNHDIVAISLDITNKGFVDSDTKTAINGTSDVILSDGNHLEISEHWFEVHTYDTQEININGENEESIFTFGNLPNIQNLLNTDRFDELTELYNKFIDSEDYIEKRILTKKMLYLLSGADNIAPDSRGGSIDARDLHVIETIMGVESFKGVDGSVDPNSNAAEILNGVCAKFEELYFNLLNANTSTYSYIDYLKETQEENGDTVLDLSTFDEVFSESMESDTKKKEIIAGIISYLMLNDYAEGKKYAEVFKAAYADYTDRMNEIKVLIGTKNDDVVNGSTGKNIFVCESGNDYIIAGSENDIVYGGSGDDTIIGDKGDDILNGDYGNDNIYGVDNDDVLEGGKGNDYLCGGYGDDTYIFNLGDGNDIINEEMFGGTEKIVFGEGIEAGNITFGRDGDDMLLLIGDKGDSIRIKNQYTDRNCIIEKFEFADGTVITSDDLFERPVVIHGEGKICDAYYGYGTRNSIIIGSDKSDEIFGDNGDDVLEGGKGNDYLCGGYGDDTYIFNLGDGNDIINEEMFGGTEKIVFGEGIEAGNITFGRDGDDMLLLIGDKGDSIRIKSQYTDRNCMIEKFEFADGTVAHIDIYTSELVIDIDGAKEEIVEQTLTEYLADIYSDEIFSGELNAERSIITDVTDSVSVGKESDELSDMSNIQAMILVENMSAFSSDSQVSSGINIGDITSDTSSFDQLLISSSVQ